MSVVDRVRLFFTKPLEYGEPVPDRPSWPTQQHKFTDGAGLSAAKADGFDLGALVLLKKDLSMIYSRKHWGFIIDTSFSDPVNCLNVSWANGKSEWHDHNELLLISHGPSWQRLDQLRKIN